KAGDDDVFAEGKIEVEALQVVLANSAQADAFGRGARKDGRGNGGYGAGHPVTDARRMTESKSGTSAKARRGRRTKKDPLMRRASCQRFGGGGLAGVIVDVKNGGDFRMDRLVASHCFEIMAGGELGGLLGLLNGAQQTRKETTWL